MPIFSPASDLSTRVPYTGATQDVNLGSYSIYGMSGNFDYVAPLYLIAQSDLAYSISGDVGIGDFTRLFQINWSMSEAGYLRSGPPCPDGAISNPIFSFNGGGANTAAALFSGDDNAFVYFALGTGQEEKFEFGVAGANGQFFSSALQGDGVFKGSYMGNNRLLFGTGSGDASIQINTDTTVQTLPLTVKGLNYGAKLHIEDNWLGFVGVDSPYLRATDSSDNPTYMVFEGGIIQISGSSSQAYLFFSDYNQNYQSYITQDEYSGILNLHSAIGQVATDGAFYAAGKTTMSGGAYTTTSIEVPAVTPPQLTGNQNNYQPNGTVAPWARISSSLAVNITGLGGGTNGMTQTFTNVGAFNITFTHQDALSSAANRILSSTGANLVLAPNASLTFRYDATAQRHRNI